MDEVQGVKGRFHQNIDESRIPLVRAFRISSQRFVGDGWAYIDSHRFIMCTISCAAIKQLPCCVASAPCAWTVGHCGRMVADHPQTAKSFTTRMHSLHSKSSLYTLSLLSRPRAPLTNGPTLEEEHIWNRPNHNTNQRQRQTSILEAHVVEHLGDPQRDRCTDEGPHERLGCYSRGCYRGVRVDNVLFCQLCLLYTLQSRMHGKMRGEMEGKRRTLLAEM